MQKLINFMKLNEMYANFRLNNGICERVTVLDKRTDEVLYAGEVKEVLNFFEHYN